MRIGLIWHGQFPWNRGIYALSKGLSKKGCEVSIVAKNSRNKPEIEDLGYARIFRFPCFKNIPFSKVFQIHFPLNFFWTWFIYRLGRKENWDVLIVRDLPLAIPAALAAKALGTGGIYDMRENYPAMYNYSPKKNLLTKILKNAKLTKLTERVALKFYQHIVVVVKEQKQRLLSMGVGPEDVTVAYNAVIDDFIEAANSARAKVTVTSDTILRLMYIGSLDHMRGLDEIIDWFGQAAAESNRLLLDIIGNGKHEEFLKDRVNNICLDGKVNFYDYFAPEEVPIQMCKRHISVINHNICEFTETTLPGKLFESMACGLPVVCSDVGPIARIVSKSKCGMVIDKYNPEQSFLDAIRTLAKNVELRRELGENGRRAVQEEYNWNKQSEKVFAICHRVAKNVRNYRRY